MMMEKSDFLSLQEPFVSWRPLPKGWGGLFGGVSLIGGLFGGLAAGLVGGVRGGVAHCVFDSGKPLPGPVSGSIKPFFAI